MGTFPVFKKIRWALKTESKEKLKKKKRNSILFLVSEFDEQTS